SNGRPCCRQVATTASSRSTNRLPASLSEPKQPLRHSTAGRRVPTLAAASIARPTAPTRCTNWRRLQRSISGSPWCCAQHGTAGRGRQGERHPSAVPGCALLDHFGGLEQYVLGDGEPERLGGPEVDHEVELARLLDGQVGGLGAPQNLVYIRRRTPTVVGYARSVPHQAPSDH